MISRRISHFSIVGLLGSGGMGDVFEAQDLRLPRSVAVKLLKPSLLENSTAVKRFQREAWLAASLNHPNICTILEFGDADGVSFIAMELLQGTSLRQRVRSGHLPIPELLALAIDVARGLDAAHRAGIVHRDLTPGNIFLTEQGGAKLLDFGLAKLFDHDSDSVSGDTVTDPGVVAGTVYYLAPEQLERRPVDRRTDLFAFGAVLYEAATGARAFEGRTKGEVIRQILTQQPVPMRHLAPHCPAELEALVAHLLEKDPARRCQRAADVLRDLDAMRAAGSSRAVGPLRSGRQVAVAVLPFAVLGGDQALRGFEDGLPQDLSWWLQQTPGIRVVPRTSIDTMRGQPIKALHERLGVAAAVEGSVQRSGSRVRVTVNILDAASEEPLHAPLRIDAQADDLLDAQDEASRQIVAALRTALARQALAVTSANSDAHFEYQRGLHYAKDLFRGRWDQVIAHASRARELDPSLAAAEVLLADTYCFLGMLSLMKPRVAFLKAEQAARRALALNADLASAHAALALVRFGNDWDWTAAEAGFRRALELDPNLAAARVYYAWLLAIQGRQAAALTEAERAVASSRSRFVQTGAVLTYVMMDRYDDALARVEACVKADPTYLYARLVRGQCHHMLRQFTAAHDDLAHAANLGGRAPHYLGLLGKSYGDAGLHEQAFAIIDELDDMAQRMYVAPHCYMYVLHGLGERDRALAFQQQAYEDGAPPINYFSPMIRDLFSLDPTHRDRLRQMRLNV